MFGISAAALHHTSPEFSNSMSLARYLQFQGDFQELLWCEVWLWERHRFGSKLGGFRVCLAGRGQTYPKHCLRLLCVDGRWRALRNYLDRHQLLVVYMLHLLGVKTSIQDMRGRPQKANARWLAQTFPAEGLAASMQAGPRSGRQATGADYCALLERCKCSARSCIPTAPHLVIVCFVEVLIPKII